MCGWRECRASGFDLQAVNNDISEARDALEKKYDEYMYITKCCNELQQKIVHTHPAMEILMGSYKKQLSQKLKIQEKLWKERMDAERKLSKLTSIHVFGACKRGFDPFCSI